MKATVATLLLGFCTYSPPILAQETPSRVSLVRTERREFASRVNGREYSVSVSLPRDYNRDTTVRYPVVYLTDPYWTFGITVQTQGLLRTGGMTPDMIIIGIARAGVDEDGAAANAERAVDLTPTRVQREERERSATYKREVRTGGAEAFLRVMREALIPDVERRYRTNGDRTYVGYSLGGLFGAFALFRAPDTFQRMVLVSPSLWWDDFVTFKYEEAYVARHKSLPVRLFLSMGETENDTMLGPMRRLASVMTDRHYQGLALNTRIFEGEEHLSTFPVAVTRGLRMVFTEAAGR